MAYSGPSGRPYESRGTSRPHDRHCGDGARRPLGAACDCGFRGGCRGLVAAVRHPPRARLSGRPDRCRGRPHGRREGRPRRAQSGQRRLVLAHRHRGLQGLVGLAGPARVLRPRRPGHAVLHRSRRVRDRRGHRVHLPRRRRRLRRGRRTRRLHHHHARHRRRHQVPRALRPRLRPEGQGGPARRRRAADRPRQRLSAPALQHAPGRQVPGQEPVRGARPQELGGPRRVRRPRQVPQDQPARGRVQAARASRGGDPHADGAVRLRRRGRRRLLVRGGRRRLGHLAS